MAALPYMPLYVADYLADAAHLSTLGHGAYLLLIMTYWQRGEPLPADDRKLARIARLGDVEWTDLRADMAEFFSERDGRWHHKRIDRELASVQAKAEQARNAGRASAERRSNGRSTPAQPPFNHTDTDTEGSVAEEATGAAAPPDPVKVLFDEGVALLTAAGSKPAAARSLIGRWRREFGDGKVMEALVDCRARAVSAPVEWLTRRLQAAQRLASAEPEMLVPC